MLTLEDKLRPFRTIKKLLELVAALSRVNEQMKTMNDLQGKIIESNNQQIAALNARIAATQKPAPPMYEEMGLPTIEAVESLVTGYFASAPLSLCRQAVEGCANPKIEPSEVLATQRLLKKLWRHAAMQRLAE